MLDALLILLTYLNDEKSNVSCDFGVETLVFANILTNQNIPVEFLWPFIKCITIEAPFSKLPANVALIDLPGLESSPSVEKESGTFSLKEQIMKESLSRADFIWFVHQFQRGAPSCQIFNGIVDGVVFDNVQVPVVYVVTHARDLLTPV
jgi:hypothetical protein